MGDVGEVWEFSVLHVKGRVPRDIIWPWSVKRMRASDLLYGEAGALRIAS